MRIFVLLSRVPYPLEKGDKLRAYHQIRELAKTNELILCALNPARKLNKQKAFSAVQPYCRSINFIDLSWNARLWNIFLAFFKNIPFQSGYFYSRKANKRVQKLIDNYHPDHIYCQLIRTVEYVKDIPIPKTLDYQDVFSYGIFRRMKKSSIMMKWFLKMEYDRLVNYEKKVFDVFDNKTIISYPDRDLIPHPDKEKIMVVPNGVDHDYFSPRESKKSFDLLFTGNMAYPPNVDAAGFLVHKIMPIVWEKLPKAKLMLAGANPDSKVLALKSKRVVVTGWMDDIRDSYSSAKIFIAPMRIGTGLQNKLLEAMSMKVPSITTPLANDALKAKENEEILIGESAEQLAEKIILLLTDQEAYQKIASNGHQFVKDKYSWQEATEKLNQLIQKTPKKN
jgi:sugar transferase (PEP-CTERM/EpsH1 system associated)